MTIEPTYCRGARGDVVAVLQQALRSMKVPSETGAGMEPAFNTVDGEFGIDMQRAVQRVQRANNLLMTGVVDAATWKLLMGAEPWPAKFERLVYVMAGFEGHFYSKATGDRAKDRVGITWGLIGFTLVQPNHDKTFRYGPLKDLLIEISSTQRDLFIDAFGKINADKLDAALKLDASELRKFAVDHLSSKDGTTLRSPWKEGFKKLGEFPAIQAMQREHARTKYYAEAQLLAEDYINNYAMDCERTLLYFLDFAIHTGRLYASEKKASEEAIRALLVSNPTATVAQKLQCVTEAVATNRPDYAKDIRERKGTLAYGYGYVHGKFYRLEGWGIDVSEPPGHQPERPHLVVLGLDDQTKEQLALAREAKNLLISEEVAASCLAANKFPEKTGYKLLIEGGTRSVTMSGLATAGAATINPNFTEHYEAAQMLFRGQTGVLAISGQVTNPIVAGGTNDQYVLQRAGRTYAGIVLKASDQLLVMRQRVAGATVAQSTVDITDLRRSLSSCALIILYGGYGVSIEGFPGSGQRWRKWVKETGANPLVVGWFGNVRPPQDNHQITVADVFLGRMRTLKPGADLLTICRERPFDVIEQWGAACHQAFSASRQKYLWLDEPIPTVSLMKSGAAAIDPAGGVWRANPLFGKLGQTAMIRV